MYILFMKGINGLVSIHNFDWPLFYSFLTSQSTLDQHLDWYLVDTRLILNWHLNKYSIDIWVTHRQPVDGKQSDRLIFIDQARCQSGVDPLLMKRSIKFWSRYQWNVDQEYWLTLDHRCLKYTWSSSFSLFFFEVGDDWFSFDAQ